MGSLRQYSAACYTYSVMRKQQEWGKNRIDAKWLVEWQRHNLAVFAFVGWYLQTYPVSASFCLLSLEETHRKRALWDLVPSHLALVTGDPVGSLCWVKLSCVHDLHSDLTSKSVSVILYLNLWPDLKVYREDKWKGPGTDVTWLVLMNKGWWAHILACSVSLVSSYISPTSSLCFLFLSLRAHSSVTLPPFCLCVCHSCQSHCCGHWRKWSVMESNRACGMSPRRIYLIDEAERGTEWKEAKSGVKMETEWVSERGSLGHCSHIVWKG